MRPAKFKTFTDCARKNADQLKAHIESKQKFKKRD